MWENIILDKDSELFNIGLVWWFVMQMDKDEQDYAFAHEYIANRNVDDIKNILKEKLSNILFYHVFYKNKSSKPNYKLYLKCLTNIINTSEKDIFPDIVGSVGRILHTYLLNNCCKNNTNIRILLSATERVLKNLYVAEMIKNNEFQYRLYDFIRSNHVDREQ